MSRKHKYATLIAKFMAFKISAEEEKELDAWVCAREENMKLFEDLTNEFKARWAKKWFETQGVSTRHIKWRKMEGWYKPETRSLQKFYLLMFVVLMVMCGVYLLLK